MTGFLSIEEVRSAAFEGEQEGRYVVAIILLEQCLQLNPIDAYAWLVLSDAYKAIGDSRACRRALDSALEYAPESERWVVQTRLAMLSAKLGLFNEAERWFEAASTADECRGLRWHLILRAANLIDLEQFTEAEKLLREAIAIAGASDELDEAHHTLGVTLLRLRKFEAARQAFDSALTINPSSTQTIAALKSLEGIAEAIDITQQLQMRTRD